MLADSIPADPTRTVHRLVGVLQFGLVVLILWTPLPFGSVGPKSVLTLELAAAFLGAIALAVVWLEPSRFTLRTRRALLPLLGLILIAILQLLPLGDTWASFAGPRAHELRTLLRETVEIAPPRSAHLSPALGLEALLRFVSYIWIGLAASVALDGKRAYRVVAVAIVISAGFQALYGAFELLSGRQQILGYVKEFYTNEATGTFINRNHFASYLAMGLSVTLAMLLSPLSRSRLTGWRERLLRLTQPSVLLRGLMVPLAAAILMGIFLSFSRAGLTVAIIATAIVVSRSRQRQRLSVWLLVACLLLPLAFLSQKEVRAPGERMVNLAHDLSSDGRLSAWRATARMAIDHAFLGTGFGTFDQAFPLYRPSEIRVRFQHAHNDWLQSASEGGWLSPILIGIFLWQLLRRREPSSTHAIDFLQLAAAAGIAAVAIHSLVDFPTKVPAVAVLLAILAGVRCSVVEEDLSAGTELP